MAELTRAQPQGMVLSDLYSQVLRTVRAGHEPIRADHLRQHRGVQNPAPRGLQADFRARLGDQPVSLAATPMPACASTTGRSGHSRASGSTWLGLANGCPAPPVCAIISTPSLAASANIIHLSADDGSTACLTVCSFSATKPSPTLNSPPPRRWRRRAPGVGVGSSCRGPARPSPPLCLRSGRAPPQDRARPGMASPAPGRAMALGRSQYRLLRYIQVEHPAVA